MNSSRRVLRLAEFILLFVAAPWLFVARELPVPLMPALWGFTAVCLVLLLRSGDFDRRQLWNAERFRRRAVIALAPVVVAIPLLLGATLWLAPERLFGFVREAPLMWAAVMLLYPVLSAYPQGIIYRTFIFHRYREVFGSPASRVAASALAFGMAHVVLQNWIAPTFTFAGGVLIAFTYERTGSSLVAALQHAAFGCVLFTLGLGWYFYYGSVG